MKAKGIFTLAVRILGLVFLYLGLTTLPNVLPALLGSVSMALWSIL